ncbi:MAG TPA: hypothetical protein VE944_01200 [Nostoc sp.]|nr:hypothetical protein [Nostoc sp.]HYX12990.1 hypothetical protein [Nostoc sp.]
MRRLARRRHRYDDTDTLAEIEAVRTEYKDGESVTIDEYVANRSEQR